MLRPIILVAQLWVPKSLFGEVFGSYMSQTKLSILPGELVMRLYPKWPTSPGDSWVPLISATVTIPVPKMLDDLLDKVTLITKLPLKHSFELLKTQKKVFLVFITQTQKFEWWKQHSKTKPNMDPKKKKAIFFFPVGPTIFGLWVMETEFPI